MNDLKVAIVGAAGRGSCFITPFESNPHTQIVALCDINTEKLANTPNKPEGVKLYSDFEQMLEQAKPDIVVVATPMPCHAEQCIAALERDVHVLGEVPAVVSIDEVKRLVQAVTKSKGQYMMAENVCYTKESVLIKSIAKAGLFGTMYFAEGEYLHELKALNEVTKWRRTWQTGVDGITYGTHCIGPVLQWMGERMVSVSCAGTGHHYTDAAGLAYEAQDGCIMLGKTTSGGLEKYGLICSPTGQAAPSFRCRAPMAVTRPAEGLGTNPGFGYAASLKRWSGCLWLILRSSSYQTSG